MDLKTRDIIDKMNNILNEKYEKNPEQDFSEQRKKWAFFVSSLTLRILKKEAGKHLHLDIIDKLVYDLENVTGVDKVIKTNDPMSIEITVDDYRTAWEINKFLVKNGAKVIEISRKEKKLEDVFMSLTEGGR